jgi:hypothetical protein
MVPDPDKACYGLEYFCFEHDGLWDSSDADLIELAKKELLQIGLAQEGDVMDGCVVRQKKAYPVYDDDYAKHVATVRNEIEERYPNLHLVGRNGMHKYNNQDHSMYTAMLTVENICDGRCSAAGAGRCRAEHLAEQRVHGDDGAGQQGPAGSRQLTDWDAAIAYVKDRRQFGKSISEYAPTVSSRSITSTTLTRSTRPSSWASSFRPEPLSTARSPCGPRQSPPRPSCRH